MTHRQSEALEQVFAARDEAELAKAYAAWSSQYDVETAAAGYALPFCIAAWLTRYVPAGAGPLLDAGCGTGLSAPYVAALGYGQIDGLDMSPEMLDLAKSRSIYRELKQAILGETLPWPDDMFAAIFSTGVFTEGHAPASAMHELVRITRPGGHIILTVRDVVLDAKRFRSTFNELTKASRWTLVEESPPFRAFAVGEPDVLVKAFVFRVA